MKKIGQLIIDKSKKILFYISLALVFIILACMIALPFGIKKTSFKNDDIVFNKKVYNVIPVDGKVNVKLYGEYVKTGISYDKYNEYIKSFNKNKTFKRTMVIELFLLFILLEIIYVHYIISNIISLFLNNESDEYKLYLNKKYFIINILSLYILDFLRRFLFRNTMFSSLLFRETIVYLLTIIILFVILKMVEMDRVFPIKEKKKYGKIKEDN